MRQIILALAVVVPALLLVVPAGATTPAADAETNDSPGAAKETVSSDDARQLAAEYYDKAVQAHADGKLELAHTLVKAAVRLDPESRAARNLLLTLDNEIEAEAVRQGRLFIHWVPKLDIPIEEVCFENAPLKDVVEFLAREADINIVFDASAMALLASDQPAEEEAAEALAEAQAGPEEAEPGFEGAEADLPPAEPPGPVRRDLVTIHLKDVPLKDVLKYVLRFKGLKYIVEDYAIVIVPVDWVDRGELVTEVFHLTTSGLGPRQIVDTLRRQPESWEDGRY